MKERLKFLPRFRSVWSSICRRTAHPDCGWSAIRLVFGLGPRIRCRHHGCFSSLLLVDESEGYVFRLFCLILKRIEVAGTMTPVILTMKLFRRCYQVGLDSVGGLQGLPREMGGRTNSLCHREEVGGMTRDWCGKTLAMIWL